MSDIKIGVAHLVWLPYGIGYFKRFLDSYRRFDAGYNHKLIVLFNGTSKVTEAVKTAFRSELTSSKIEQVEIMEFAQGQDIEIYRAVAQKADVDYLLFLNSYSVLLADNWLRYYVNNQIDGVGLIGASGSYSSYKLAIARHTGKLLKEGKPLEEKWNALKYLLKLYLLYGSKFPSFPNPHIRTNAFFIKCTLMCNLQIPKVKSKIDAYIFENGKNSMTNQIFKKGLKCVVIDKFGKAWEMEAWEDSKTFWSGEQQGLLVADNQTKKYAEGNQLLKDYLHFDAWRK